jgi:ribonuclease BN (tRNA processing enzyme)
MPSHEAAFLDSEAARAAADGHTTGYQAGDVARQAGALRLLLCREGAGLHRREGKLCQEARWAYHGPVEVVEKSQQYRV